MAPPVRHIATEFAPDPAAIVRLGAAIASARRPVFVVGPEIDRSFCVDAMIAVAERARAAVWASPMSSRSSFPELHPRFAGFLPAAPGGLARALRDADLIVVIGAPVFTFHVEGQCELLDDGTPVWQITDDPTEAASAAVGDTIISTLPKALVALQAALPAVAKREMPAARTRPAAPAAQNPIPPTYALSRLSALMPRDAIVVEEAPSHRPAIQQFLPRPGADSFYTMASGGLGYSLPASVGVALARPGRRIVALIGDGSAMYCIQAIWTAAQRQLPITFVIMNNSGYGAMRAFSRLMQAHHPPGIDLPGLDFVALARGMGCAGQRLTDAGDVDRILSEALASRGPALVEIAVDDATTDLFSHSR